MPSPTPEDLDAAVEAAGRELLHDRDDIGHCSWCGLKSWHKPDCRGMELLRGIESAVTQRERAKYEALAEAAIARLERITHRESHASDHGYGFGRNWEIGGCGCRVMREGLHHTGDCPVPALRAALPVAEGAE